MLLKTFYPHPEDMRGTSRVKEICYMFPPRIDDVVIIDGIEFFVKYVIHDSDENKVTVVLK